MKKYLLIGFVLLCSCGIQKMSTETRNQFFKFGINIKSENESVYVSGTLYLDANNSYFNVFGPLGINLAKLKISGDSLIFVDIPNKVIYLSVYKNISSLVNNIFFNNFSEKEQLLISALLNYVEKEASQYNFNILKNYEIKYSFSGSKKKNIEIMVRGSKANYLIEIKYIPDQNKSNSFQLDKYKNFKIIPVNLQ